MSADIYGLAPGAVDAQNPHDQDEIYYVISGRAHFRVGDEDRSVQPDDTFYVAAQVPHKFHTISEDLTLLVFFAPAEG
ncbi:MAG: cupin domain-containing protein [Caldilineaceae bacterium]|nr:cupin domain-containing protein [Caldilineaceae bacterium]